MCASKTRAVLAAFLAAVQHVVPLFASMATACVSIIIVRQLVAFANITTTTATETLAEVAGSYLAANPEVQQGVRMVIVYVLLTTTAHKMGPACAWISSKSSWP